MSRINTNVESIRAIGRLNSNLGDLSVHIERLATGLRINRGKDDPAGLIASERLRGEIGGFKQALANSQRSLNVVSVAEAALNEVSTLLIELRGLITLTSNEDSLSPEEIDANQLQIDSIVDSINRIANTTQFAGRKLLDGTLAYTVSGQTTSQVADIAIFAARLPSAGGVTVSLDVTTSAQKAELAFNRGAALPLASAVTIEVTGNLGTEVVSLQSGASLSEVATAINNFTSLTGVTAALSGTSAVVLNSSKFGSDQFVSVKTISGTFTTAAGLSTSDSGLDVGLIINGQTAKSDGLSASIRTTAIDLDITLTSSFAQQLTNSSSFVISGGGAQYAISPFITGVGIVNLGIPSARVTNLGNAVDGYLESIKTGGTSEVREGHFQSAETIVTKAINQVSELRGRMGAFQRNVVETNMNSMQIALENITASESDLRDADMAQEISGLTLKQILVQSSIQVLAIANQQPTSVLQLLG